MYQVLYRKWRPKSFDDVVGQPHITTTLKNELNQGRIGHAYLFIGSRGTGKTTCAKILAKAVNCLHPISGNPCGECEVCRGIDSGAIMDVVEMDAASNNSVNDIRLLCEEMVFTPAVAKFRVYIVDEVHMLTQGAFNALLKTLEEPPEHVIFILATTEVHKIPATILSRCQKFEFHRISPEDICQRLQYVAAGENAKISDDAALLLAKISDGALRDALSLLDKCMSSSKGITSDVVTEVVGLVPKTHLFALTESIATGNASAALDVIDNLSKKSKDMAFLCDELMEHMRILMLTLTMANSKEVAVISEDEYLKFRDLSKSFSVDQVIKVMDVLANARDHMSFGSDKRIILEAAIVKLASDFRKSANEQTIVARIEKLEKLIETGLANVSVTNSKIQNKMKSIPLTEPVESSDKSCVDIEDLTKNAKPFEKWHDVLCELKKYSQTAALAFAESSAYVSGGFILIDTNKETALEMLRQSNQREKIRKAISNVTGKAYKLGPYKKVVSENNLKIDPLDEFAEFARKSGVNVEVK